MASDHASSAVIGGITLAIIRISGLVAVEVMMCPAHLPGKPLKTILTPVASDSWKCHIFTRGWW